MAEKQQRKSSKEKPGINFSLKELADSFNGRLKLDKNTDKGKEVVCSKHTKTPAWFCVDEDRAVCDDCQNPPKHSGHKVIPLEEAVEDMKGYQSTKSRAQCTLRDPPLLSGALIDVAKHLGNLRYRVCEKMVDTVEYHPVILDASTASPRHILSEDLTSVREMETKQHQLENPERFMKYNDVLGSEGFTSGKHCWEVQVGDRSQWSLGVAKETVERKGVTFLGPKYGFWAVKKINDEYIAPLKTLSLKTKSQRVRVQLDYERGEVYFYDPSDMSYIYTYKVTFKDKLFPYFSTEGDESETSFQICPFKVFLTVKKL
ncbi:zinc-binding protein A33-like [Alosa pseudoharengus]|uniref:zinc-binding protein A33-like n=1 Tax=Alosa pseudoharengus TaxID=34774 RepID=UPI003F88FFC5